MELLLVLLVAGLVLPPRYSLRLGGAGIVALAASFVFTNTAAGHGSDPFGQALLVAFVVLFLGAIMLGLVLRWLWNSRHGIQTKPEDLAAPLADRALMFSAMVLPAGIAALWLGDLLSGTSAPLRTHILLLAGLAVTAVVGLAFAHGLIRAGLLGFAVFMAVIVADSMRLERQLQTNLPKDRAFCLVIGPDRLAAADAPPLMGLTAPKPILIHIADPARPQFRRWSFRWHGFVRGGINPEDVPCTPARP